MMNVAVALLLSLIVCSCNTVMAFQFHLNKDIDGDILLETTDESIDETDEKASCGVLKNEVSYHSIAVSVGSPPQTMNVVADTGSDILIFQSCQCQHDGYCEANGVCFKELKSTTLEMMTGTAHEDGKLFRRNDSSLFYETRPFSPHATQALMSGRQVQPGSAKELPLHLSLEFGSGTIQGLLATDKASFAHVQTTLSDGFMLMTAAQLDFSQALNGILGLGPNMTMRSQEERKQSKQNETPGGGNTADLAEFADPDGDDDGDGDGDGDGDEEEIVDGDGDGKNNSKAPTPDYIETDHEPMGVLEQKGLESFSVCFNNGEDGVLRISPRQGEQPHASMGLYHWGVGLHGMTIGDEEAEVMFCNATNLSKGQLTPCGAIPDSGTTLLVGPEEHVNQLLGSLCSQWPRCKDNHTALVKAAREAKKHVEKEYGFDPWEIESYPMTEVLNLLVSDCDNWLEDNVSIADELPPIFMHVEGMGKTKQTLEIPAYSYVFVEEQEEIEYDTVTIPGWGEFPSGEGRKTGRWVTVCSMGFSTMDYSTEANGPIWIVGSALFHEYEVGYNLRKNTVSFTPLKSRTCGACDNNGQSSREDLSSLDSLTAATKRQHKRTGFRAMRRMERGTSVRRPNYDTSLPL